MFQLNMAPAFAQANPEIYCDAFQVTDVSKLATLTADIDTLVDSSISYIESRVPEQRKGRPNPEKAISYGGTNCIGRAALLHTLLSPFSHIESGMEYVFEEQYGAGHMSNVVSELQGGTDLVIDNVITARSAGKFRRLVPNSREDGVYGGATATYELLGKRRHIPESMRPTEDYLWLLDVDGFPLVSASELEFDRAAYNDGVNDRVAGVVWFGTEATKVVDMLTGMDNPYFDAIDIADFQRVLDGSASGFRTITDSKLEHV